MCLSSSLLREPCLLGLLSEALANGGMWHNMLSTESGSGEWI